MFGVPALALPKKGRYRDVVSLEALAMFCFAIAFAMFFASRVVFVRADNFTDVFYTNSFRGSFEWFSKLDWIGLVVQAVISIFSLVGVALIVIRIMTSLLYLSAKGLWEEVHDLKSTGDSGGKDFIGLLGMGKAWAQGKSGTGLDAFLGAILMLLPDVKRYSDFGEKSGTKFEDDTTVTQYILKIALPTVMAVFFLAMGFNGTLVKALAVTVDAMGTVADKAVSVNYSGFVDDLINSGSGYRFSLSADSSELGALQQSVAKDIYGRILKTYKGMSTSQMQDIGAALEKEVRDNVTFDAISGSSRVSSDVKAQLSNSVDQYVSYIGYELVSNTSSESNADVKIELSTLANGISGLQDDGGGITYHIFFKQTNSSTGSYLNVDEVQ